MISSHCLFSQNPLEIPEILFKTVTFNDQSSFNPLQRNQKKIWHIISLSLTCKKLYTTIYSQAFLRLLVPHRQSSENDSFIQKEWIRLNRWQRENLNPQITCGTSKGKPKQHAFYDQGELTIYGTSIEYADKKTHLHRTSETKETQNSLNKQLTPPSACCYPAYACSLNLVAILSDYNAIYFFCKKTSTLFGSPIIFEEGTIRQIAMDGEELYVMIEKSQQKTRELHIFDLSNKKEKQCPIPFSTECFYLCDHTIFFLLKEENKCSVKAMSQETLEWFMEEKHFPENRTGKIASGDRALFSITKDKLFMQIDKIKLDQHLFCMSQWQFSLKGITNKNTFEQATIYLVHYHLEKIFIYLSNHYCLVYDLSSKKIDGLFFMLPPDVIPDQLLIDKKDFYLPQTLVTSFKIHFLFPEKKGRDPFITRIFTLDYTHENKKLEPSKSLEEFPDKMEIDL